MSYFSLDHPPSADSIKPLKRVRERERV